jgi:hypothetical protein
MKLCRYFSCVLLGLLLSVFAGCVKNKSGKDREPLESYVAPAADSTYFQEIGSQIGLNFTHSIGGTEMKNIVESVGGGAAFLDYDNDGFLDIYACSGIWIEGFSKSEKPDRKAGNRLYRNKQDGTFEDVTEKARVSGDWYSMGVSVGDFNNDGFADIFLSNYGKNTLLQNQGDGTFSDASQKSGLEGGMECSVGATWLDYDNDGLLDIYVGNYLNFDPEYKYYYAPDGFPGPLAYDAQPDRLYRNTGDGSFEEVTEQMGISDLDGRAMGVGSADYDHDGFMDILVANDHTVNYMWHNDQGKGFTDLATLSGTGFSQAGEATVSMSVDYADYNKDELLDIFISDDNYCSLYENMGNGVFRDNSYVSGISVASGQFVGWSSSFLDFDNDSDPDLFKTNGELKHLYGQEDQIFENTGEGLFKDVSVSLGGYFKEEHVGRGACIGDYDNDGDLDIFIVNLNAGSRFLRNNKGNQGNWLIVNLVGTKSNRDGVGASLRLTADDEVQIAQKKSTSGYLSQSDPRIHFGLADKMQIDRLEIVWPSGTKQSLEQIPVNQILTVEEPD